MLRPPTAQRNGESYTELGQQRAKVRPSVCGIEWRGGRSRHRSSGEGVELSLSGAFGGAGDRKRSSIPSKGGRL